MKFEDTSQNLRARLRFIQVLVILMIGALGVRLYVLQVVRGDKYAEIAENQRRRRLLLPTSRHARHLLTIRSNPRLAHLSGKAA